MYDEIEVDGISIPIVYDDETEETTCHIADWLKAHNYSADSEDEFRDIMEQEGLNEFEIDEMWDEILDEYHQFCWDNNLTPDVYDWY